MAVLLQSPRKPSGSAWSRKSTTPRNRFSRSKKRQTKILVKCSEHWLVLVAQSKRRNQSLAHRLQSFKAYLLHWFNNSAISPPFLSSPSCNYSLLALENLGGYFSCILFLNYVVTLCVTSLVAPGRTDDDPQRLNKSFVQNSEFRSLVGPYGPFKFFSSSSSFMHDPYPHGGIVIK
jgi:hypothetical protein